MTRHVLKLLDEQEIDKIAEKLNVNRAELIRDISSSATQTPIFVGFDRQRENESVGRVLAAAELASGVFAEVELSESVATFVDDGDCDLAPALIINYTDKAMRLHFTAYTTEVAIVRERSVSDANFAPAKT